MVHSIFNIIHNIYIRKTRLAARSMLKWINFGKGKSGVYFYIFFLFLCTIDALQLSSNGGTSFATKVALMLAPQYLQRDEHSCKIF